MRLKPALAGIAVWAAGNVFAGTPVASTQPLLSSLPGRPPFSPQLQRQLQQAQSQQRGHYEVRSAHRQADGRPRFTNRLLLENAPYLLQHAHNPVNWYPWGKEAFQAARRGGKPVFLSIGYSTCHWCNAMEEESFDNLEIARYLNKHFVSIKVDREQRPDLDAIYMTSLEVMEQSSGWPITTFLTAEGAPFFGVTYLPREKLRELLATVVEQWHSHRPQLLQDARRVADQLAQITAVHNKAGNVGSGVIETAIQQLLAQQDTTFGGLKGASKFPHESTLLLLLDHAWRHGHKLSLVAVERTLTQMALGGIRDHVGGGFHRYTADSGWRIPHFEKMLFNQALLASVYSQAFAFTGRALYRRVAQECLAYVLRDLRAPHGGFYSATAADSEGREGVFYTWTHDQLEEALGTEQAALAAELFAVKTPGPVHDANVLHLPLAPEAYARSHGIPVDTLLARMSAIKHALYERRETRPHPFRDEKIITSWNSMMISALADGYRIFGEKTYLQAAQQAAHFLWQHLWRENTSDLLRIHYRSHSASPATQPDYAYLAAALLDLYDITAHPLWLARAKTVTDAMIAHFEDDKQGGFWMTPPGQADSRITAIKSLSDSPIPAGNAVALRNFARLSQRSDELRYRVKMQETLAAFGEALNRQPAKYSYLLLGLSEARHGSRLSPYYFAFGVGRVHSEILRRPISGQADTEQTEAVDFALQIEMAEGWHINAHQPSQDFLIPTKITVLARKRESTRQPSDWALSNVQYPQSEVLRLGFADQSLALYTGQVAITGTMVSPATQAIRVLPLTLQLQACDDRRCLPPETLAIPTPYGSIVAQ